MNHQLRHQSQPSPLLFAETLSPVTLKSGLLLAATSGLLLAFAIKVIPWLAWVALAPLLSYALQASPRQAGVVSFLMWASLVAPFTVGMSPFPGGIWHDLSILLGTALCYGLATGLAVWLRGRQSPTVFLVILPAVLVSLQAVLELPMGRMGNALILTQTMVAF